MKPTTSKQVTNAKSSSEEGKAVRLFTEARSDSEYTNFDCDYMLITVTPHDAKRYLRLLRALEAIEQAGDRPRCIEVMDHAECYSGEAIEPVEDELGPLMEVCCAVTLPGGLDLPTEKAERTDGHSARVYEHGITWLCFPKHTDVRISSPIIPWGTIENAAGIKRGV